MGKVSKIYMERLKRVKLRFPLEKEIRRQKMIQSRSTEYLRNSGELSKEMYGEAFRKAYKAGYLETNPKIRAKNKRLLEDALKLICSAEKTKDPEGVLKGLFALYEEIDPNSDYIRPGEREFFPQDKKLRTLGVFLQGFNYIYYILKRAQERIYLNIAFGNFWERCIIYLRRCKYSERFISKVCAGNAPFYRQSFNYWRQEFQDSEEGFSIMYEYFKACFGIEGNDEYCCIDNKREVTYDWRRMKASYDRFYKKPVYSNPVLEPPDYVPPSDKTLRMLRERIKLVKNKKFQNHNTANALLLEIQKRNKKRGYFQELG